MTPQPAASYNGFVLEKSRRGVAGLLVAVGCLMGLAAPARADEQIGVGPTPVVDVMLGHGAVTVQTWDKPQVQIFSNGTLKVQHLDSSAVDPYLAPGRIPGLAHTVDSEHGPVTLAPESFVLPKLDGSSHDEVRARGNGDVTLMVPRSTALVVAHVDRGNVNLNDYHGAFDMQVHNGGVYLNRVGGSGYVESLRGPIVASDSSFDRLRARTATGDMTFNGCTSRQIDASSAYGSIVYDNGQFAPGLARFESEHGNVALGVRGGAQIGAHTESGRVVSSFPNGTSVAGNPNTAQALVGGGGPVVTATSKDGSVYLYNGSMDRHPRMQAEMRGAPVFRAPAGRAPIFRAPRRFVPPGSFVPPPREVNPRQLPPRQFIPPRQFAPPPHAERRHHPNGQPPP